MADQKVELAPYDPSWPDVFAAQSSPVEQLLAPWLAGPVEHIGSTAVPGLPAKPVIDMLAPVTSLAAAADALPALDEAGWMFWPEDPCRHYRMWFLRPSPYARTHHLHVIEDEDPHARALLAFRDALRADPRLRREYAELKVRLARRHAGNRNAYTNAKAGFVDRALRAAGAAAPPSDALPE